MNNLLRPNCLFSKSSSDFFSDLPRDVRGTAEKGNSRKGEKEKRRKREKENRRIGEKEKRRKGEKEE